MGCDSLPPINLWTVPYQNQMSKKERIKKNKIHEIGFSEPDVFIKKEFVPLTKAQKDYWNAIDQNIITISVGCGRHREKLCCNCLCSR
jgi:phosphate starvation-inducible protein PhoH